MVREDVKPNVAVLKRNSGAMIVLCKAFVLFSETGA